MSSIIHPKIGQSVYRIVGNSHDSGYYNAHGVLNLGNSVNSSLIIEEFTVVKLTPKGFRYVPKSCVELHKLGVISSDWASVSSGRMPTTKKAALRLFVCKKEAHIKHIKRRMCYAESQLGLAVRSLGDDIEDKHSIY